MTARFSPRFEKLRRWYVASAVMLLNVVLVAAVFGGVFVLVRIIKSTLAERARISPVEKRYGDRIFKAYPDLSKDEARALLWETWTRPCVFEPFTQFKERPFSGRFVNVSAQGFRHSQDQAAWPPDTNAFNVFLFGGSTAFGYGVSDTQTMASFLQAWLRTNMNQHVNVYNFGRAYYFSSQEAVLFMRLLANGHVPRLALFLDGMNDSAYVDDLPQFSDRLREMMERKKGASSWLKRDRAKNPSEVGGLGEPSTNIAERVVRHYRTNMQLVRALAGAYGVRVAFIWQPVPNYKYDLQYHDFNYDNFKRHRNAPSVYELMNKERVEFINDGSFIWCADLQEGVAQAFYVDEVHYNPVLNRILAHRIGEALQTRGFLTSQRTQPVSEALP